jgi:hypothetical protein
MAKLHCESAPEKLLIPAFLLFFNLLYPMRRVNRRPAAAGGCMLVRRDAFERAGGFETIRDRVIDDIGLARALKPHGRLRLAVSRSDVVSVRAHDLGGIWHMVRRTAFTQLRRSWPLLAVTIALLALLFVVPPVATVVAAVTDQPVTLGIAAAAWALMTGLYLPTVRYFRLPPSWALTLPFAACLFGAMTVDSAVRGRRSAW